MYRTITKTYYDTISLLTTCNLNSIKSLIKRDVVFFAKLVLQKFTKTHGQVCYSITPRYPTSYMKRKSTEAALHIY